mgnify:FL=1
MLLPDEYLGRFKAIGEHQFSIADVGNLLLLFQLLRVEGILAARKESRLRVPDADNKSATFTRDPPDTW